jgi:hypothetical protein
MVDYGASQTTMESRELVVRLAALMSKPRNQNQNNIDKIHYIDYIADEHSSMIYDLAML